MFILDNSKGYIKLHWELLYHDDLDIMEAVFLEYIIAVYPILRQTKDINGLTYKRLFDSGIQEVFNVTSPAIRRWLNKLNDLGFIKIENTSFNEGSRYIYLNVLTTNSKFEQQMSGYGV